MNNLSIKSDSILKKRIRRFKSIKRGYYSFIIIVSLYLLSFLTPLFLNSKALIVCYANNIYDIGETYTDNNQNNIWDIGEPFSDKHNYYFPALSELFEGILSSHHYDAKFFGQDSIRGKIKYGDPNYRILQKTFKKDPLGNFVIMPFYPFDPIEEVLSERDEIYIDKNNNNKYDDGEYFIDENMNGNFDEFRPATFPDNINIFGTDNQGRDVFARLVYGFNVTLTFALLLLYLHIHLEL